MLVKDVMNKMVMLAGPDIGVAKVAKLISKQHIGSLVIVDEKEKILGILTERDILMDVVAKGKNLKHVKAKDIMTKNVTTIEPDRTIEDAVEIMKKNGIKKLPVVYRNKIIGIITANDIVTLQPEMAEELKSLLGVDSERKEIVFGPKKNIYMMLKSKLNTIFGSFQVFLGLLFFTVAYLFYYQVAILKNLLPSETSRILFLFILGVFGGVFIVSGSFLLSLES